jgi:hypothetical protein
MILTWRANIDFWPVINREAVIAYVAQYASKADSQSSSYQEILQTAISRLEDTDAGGITYQKMLSTFAAERDISAQETCHILMGCRLVCTSRPAVCSLCVDPHSSSGLLNFESGGVERLDLVERYEKCAQAHPEKLKDVTLLELATNWDWTKEKPRKCGSKGAKPYVVNVWPHFRPDKDNDDIYEKYCYAKMILHHPFTQRKKRISATEPGKYISWLVAYQAECLDQYHVHFDDTLPNATEEPDIDDDDSDSESIMNEDEPEPYRAEWMQEAG